MKLPEAPPLAGGPAAEDELAEGILSRGGAPVDAGAVAALLESEGLRDVDAVERYAKRDVFDLADSVYARCIERLRARPRPAASPASRRGTDVRLLLRGFARGAFSFVPLAIQLVSLLAFGYSQWAWRDFSTTQASVVAVAVGLSFVVTGGFSQALGYLTPFFEEPGKHMLTRKLIHRILAIGLGFALVTGGLCVAVAALLDAYPGRLLAIALGYYVFVSVLWLVTAVLYVLRRYLAMTVATLAGVGAVVLVRGVTPIGIYPAHWLGVSVSVAVALVWAEAFLASRAAATSGDLRLAVLPRAGMLLGLARPYLVFGTLYFGFIVLDRAIGWSAGEHPLPVWFRTPYELGLDLALVAVVAGIAFLEYTVDLFSHQMVAVGEETPGAQVAEHNSRFVRLYRQQLAVVLLLLGVGAAAGYAALAGLGGVTELGDVGKLLEGSVTRHVFLWAVAGYVLLAIGLANAVFLFSAGRPWPVVRAMLPAFAVNAALGILLSGAYEYWYSVIGMTAGALVFAVITTRSALGVVRQADYHLFAAY